MANNDSNRPNSFFGLISEILSFMPYWLKVISGVLIVGGFIFVLAYPVLEKKSGSTEEQTESVYSIIGKIIDLKTKTEQRDIVKVCLEGYSLKCDESIADGVFLLRQVKLLPSDGIVTLRIYFPDNQAVTKDVELPLPKGETVDLGDILIQKPVEAIPSEVQQDAEERKNSRKKQDNDTSESNCVESGQVLNENGMPLVGARVSLVSGSALVEANTDSMGTYHLAIPANLDRNSQYRLEARKNNLKGAVTKSICDGNIQPIIVK